MLAQTPPMGWNSWNTFGENISEALIMETADAIVDRGFKDAGYEYVVIDDCWSLRERDENGRLVADPAKFPHGMKYLSDYIHSKGLKFGMYACCGTTTCAGYPGSYDHEFTDAETFASWGVDYLKYDYCARSQLAQKYPELLYRRMGIALKATGREIMFSACNWGRDDVFNWARRVGAHLYRSTGDISDNFESMKDIGMSQIGNLATSAPGCFNDPDMLICGMYGSGNVAVDGCTFEQYKLHFAHWCMMSAPLMIGCDVRNCDEQTRALLTDKTLLSIDQDEDCRPPFSVVENYDPHAGACALFKHLSHNRYVFFLGNFTETAGTNPLQMSDWGVSANCGYTVELHDMATGEVIKPRNDMLYVYCDAYTYRLFEVKVLKK